MTPNHSSQPGLSIVIPNWNGRTLLEKFLPSVIHAAAAFEAACGQATEIVIADDASTDDSRVWLRARWPEVRFEPGDRQQGFAPTANRGMQAARFALVYLLNNDVALAPGTLPPLAAHFRDPHVFAVASEAYDYSTGVLRGAGQWGKFRRGFLGIHDRFFSPSLGERGGHVAPPLLTLYASGGSSLFDREKFLKLGGFDEMIAPFGWEDVELSLRAWKQGFEIRYEPQSPIWHQFSSTIAPRFSQRRVKAVYERNRLLAHWLHLDTFSQAAAHAFFLLLKLLASPFAGHAEVWSAFAQAVARSNEVRARREKLRAKQQRRLDEVLREIAEQMHRPEVCRLDAGSAPVRPYAHQQNHLREEAAAELRRPGH